MHRYQQRDTRNIEKQGRMTPMKEHNDSPEIDPHLREIYKMTEKFLNKMIPKKFMKCRRTWIDI